MTEYVLHWQLLSGASGHGEPLSEELAEVWLKHMTEHHPDDLYWIEAHESEDEEAQP